MTLEEPLAFRLAWGRTVGELQAASRRKKAMRKLIGALAAILVLILAEDLHAMPLGGAVGAVSTFSPVEKITCWRSY
jgi:hypothetical protein